MRPWLVKLAVVRLALTGGAWSDDDWAMLAQASAAEIQKRGSGKPIRCSTTGSIGSTRASTRLLGQLPFPAPHPPSAVSGAGCAGGQIGRSGGRRCGSSLYWPM